LAQHNAGEPSPSTAQGVHSRMTSFMLPTDSQYDDYKKQRENQILAGAEANFAAIQKLLGISPKEFGKLAKLLAKTCAALFILIFGIIMLNALAIFIGSLVSW
jgi:hypothetical protein